MHEASLGNLLCKLPYASRLKAAHDDESANKIIDSSLRTFFPRSSIIPKCKARTASIELSSSYQEQKVYQPRVRRHAGNMAPIGYQGDRPVEGWEFGSNSGLHDQVPIAV